MDKSLILNELMKYYNFKRNVDFADFLGIKPQLLSNWFSRNTYDIELLYTKCVEISPDWLMTGKGEMLRQKSIKDINEPQEKLQWFQELEKEVLKKDKSLLEIISNQSEIIKNQTELINGLLKPLTSQFDSHGKKIGDLETFVEALKLYFKIEMKEDEILESIDQRKKSVKG